MHEDHIEYGLDATSKTYYHRNGPDMVAVRMARFGLNRRHFPNHSASFLDRHPEAKPLPSPTLQRGRTALERASERAAMLNELGASPATIAAAMGEVRRIAAKLADIEERPTRRVIEDDKVPALLAQYKAERSDLSARIKRLRADGRQLAREFGDEIMHGYTHAAIAELQESRIRVQRFIDALERRMPAPTERPSSNRPERCCLVSQTMVVGSFDETNPTEPVGYAVFEVPDFEWANVEAGEPSHIAQAFFVTQFVYKNVPVRNDLEVHKLNRSYLMGGEPMLYPPKSKSYRVMEPAESYHGPFAHADEAEQVAANWKSECLDIYNDSDRILGWDVEPT